MTQVVQLHEVIDENSTLRDGNYYCFEQGAQSVQRCQLESYLLDLDVVFENQTINAVLFGDVVAVVVGCSVQEYIDSLEKDPFNSPNYDHLVSSNWREYKFLFKLDKS
ncbi:hypothetical protein Leryth_026671 [Lithospermum erythrorhizon]|nr:hypothetical protein Leryth_026671 [Lithospermum erythrorhizon]